ncbi:MAG: chitobiase/beta-hexosaminidase C-terminal domain-containing protein [Acidobacteriaceae bacterium]
MTVYFLLLVAVSCALFYLSVAIHSARSQSSSFFLRPIRKSSRILCATSVFLLLGLAGCGTQRLTWNGGLGAKPTHAATPTFSPAAGTYASPQAVTISDITPGATIYYTTDGTAPTATSVEYSRNAVRNSFSIGNSIQIPVAANETIQAIAVLPNGENSAVASAAYTIATAEEEKVEQCQDGILPQGSANTDLQITGTSCLVDGNVNGGTYIYRNVNIWGGGSLNFADAKINFHAHSILVENRGSLVAGSSAPAVGPITIWLYGSANDGIPPITCKSGPTCGVPDDIWNSNSSMAMHMVPSQKCTPASNFSPSPVGSDCFYRYDPLDPGAPDNAYFSKKSLVVSYGGTIYLRGAKGIRPGPIDSTPSDSGTSWVRLTDTLKGGESSFHVDRPVPMWGSGDHIVLTSTDYLPSHSEEVVIDSVMSDSTGTKVTLKDPLQFPHNGTTYDFSSVPATSGPQNDANGPATLPSRHLETRAAVALLTRSIMVASEGPTPVLSDRTADHFPADSFYGGQTIARQGFATYQVQGVEFYHLGQGGVIGRYPVHFHMDRIVPQPTVDPPFAGTYIADSSIHDSMTRFITVHATQGLLISRNVGYRSIGHGFYLEDSTEINNRLYANIGIESRAAVDDALNPRKVPGILAKPGQSGADVFPFHSDYDHPTIFWLTNGWNDLRYNVAVGAGTCGACYWMPPSVNSGPSIYETWSSYASMQTNGRGGLAPIQNFVGNSCSTAMNSIETVSNTGQCLGVVAAGDPTPNTLQAIANPNPLPDNRYPAMDGGLRQHATVCDAAHQSDCSTVPICTGSGANESGCAVTTIDHYTTSFNWAAKNFAAVWLRGWWYLLRDSAITDVQGGGLTFVTGGGYTRSDAAQGFWNLSQRVLFVGNTQPINSTTGVPDNAAASNAGPFNPYALKCPDPNQPYCISSADDATFSIDSFSGAQRMISIYDGPSFEDSDAFMDVHTTDIGTLGDCKPGGNNGGSCRSSGWMNGYQSGAVQVPPGNQASNHCVLPNAAIAWKQPNGFYYPPAFHSQNLTFQNVDIRHFVVQPLWVQGSFAPDLNKIKQTYCAWEQGDFTQFTDVDRQTELSDDDGALTGLVSGTPPNNEPSISVTKDTFYNAPLVTPECASSAPTPAPGAAPTVDTSPYQYVTTAIYPQCSGYGGSCLSSWSQFCTNQQCYGVPLYREYLTNAEYTAWQTDPKIRPSIRMMGQATGQRSSMTVNHGSYYIDTTLNATDQNSTADKNVFLAGQPYYLYLLFATPHTKQTYSLYIGGQLSNDSALATVVPGTVNVETAKYQFTPNPSGNWITKSYNATNGVLSVTIDLSGQTQTFDNDRPKFCQPQTYCSIHNDGSCGCAPGSNCTDNSVCAWSNKEIDCPIAGCFGFSITMPAGFVAAKQPNLPPAPIHFVGDSGSDPYFAPGTVQFYNVNQSISGAQCHYSTPPVQQ